MARRRLYNLLSLPWGACLQRAKPEQRKRRHVPRRIGRRPFDLLVHRGAFSFFVIECDRVKPRLVLFFPRFLLEIEECDHFMPCGGWRVAQTRARGRIRNAKECERGRNGERRRSTDGARGRFFLSFLIFSWSARARQDLFGLFACTKQLDETRNPNSESSNSQSTTRNTMKKTQGKGIASSSSSLSRSPTSTSSSSKNS